MSNRWTAEDLAEKVAANPDLHLAGQKRAVKPSGSMRRPAPPQARTGQRGSKLAVSGNLSPLTFTVPGPCAPKPRQTRRDKWAKRPSVLRYHTWADLARAEMQKAAGRRFLVARSYGRVKAVMYFPIPRSWNKTTQQRMKNQPHELRPDIDNCGKSVLDALYPTGDARVSKLDLEKLWDDGEGPRTVITLY